MNTTAYYAGLPTEELLRRAEQHTDPFVHAIGRRLDETNYQLRIYRTLLGLPNAPATDSRQLDLFKGNENGKAV